MLLQYWLAVFVVILIIVFLIMKKNRHRTNFPPGPMGLPILGYLPFLGRDVHLKLGELGKKYGDVFSVQLGSETVVVLHSACAAKEGLCLAETQGRPVVSAFSQFEVKSSFFTNDMTVWLEQRKFIVHALKDLGLGKTKLEQQIMEEISDFVQLLRDWQGCPMPFDKYLLSSISNNICALVLGQRYKYEDPERALLDQNIDRVIALLGQTGYHIFLPWLKHVPFVLKWMKYEEGQVARRSTVEIIKKNLQEREETFDPNNIRDFIDSYLLEMRQRKQREPHTTFSENTLIANAMDLIGAGSESVRTTLSWLMYTMAAYPDIQEKVLREILDILGPDRPPEFLDQKNMPFTHAVILEIMRWKTIVPINALRCTTSDTRILGCDIPKGTTITANFWAIHHDPELWPDPDTFKPERFLSQDGKTVHKPSHFMPFALGKRICLGENMAFMEIFLYFTTILQKFVVHFPQNYRATFDAEITIVYKLKPFQLCFRPRNF